MYQDLKLIILELTGLSRDAIHIYIGMSVFFAMVAIFRKGKIEAVSLLPVLAAAAAMEIADLYESYSSMGPMYWGDSVHDLINTMLWPVVIVVLVKFNHVLKAQA